MPRWKGKERVMGREEKGKERGKKGEESWYPSPHFGMTVTPYK